ncbi:aldehyde dehydrogenase [Lentzea roselyniae]|uniref:Aldehyde dehydrogenase n=1 Tax=Lentzea roselyniae TaxID=531940 RepID=A0ABP7C908_9PSEU
MRSYDPYVGGADLRVRETVHCLRASVMLRDFLPSLVLKRELDRGRRHDAENHPSVVARCGVADEAIVAEAIKAAAAAAPEWAAYPLDVRMRLVGDLHDQVRDRHDEFVDVLIAEGHPRLLAEWEVACVLQESCAQTREWVRGELHREYRSQSRRLALIRRPDGVVAFSPPRNAAAANSALAIYALAAGNTLVMKAPRSTPLGVMYFWRDVVAPLLDEIGAPPGTLNIVCGNPSAIIRQWLDSPLIDDIFFMGSTEQGLPLGVEAARRNKKVILELSGNDGVVVWRDADLDRAAEALTECFYGSGQICMVPKHAVVHPAVAEELLDRLRVLAGRIRPGYPEDAGTLLSPVVKSDMYFAYLNDAVAAGAAVLCGGNRIDVDGQRSTTGAFIEPTVLRLDGLARASRVQAVIEETFFPLLPVVVPEPDDDRSLLGRIIDFVNSNRYGLRNSLWAADSAVIEEFTKRVTNCGQVKVNDSHIGCVPYLASHGGTGLSSDSCGELNYVALRTSHLQGISVGTGIDPGRAVFESPLRPMSMPTGPGGVRG